MEDYGKLTELANKELSETSFGEKYEVKVKTVEKTNGVKKTAFCLGLKTGEDVCTSPLVYAEPFFATFSDWEIAEYIVRLLTENMDEETLPKISNLLKAENLFVALINKDKNKNVLHFVPHKEYGNDLVIVYRLFDPEGAGSALVTYDILNAIAVSEDKLFDLALKNTFNVMEPTITPIGNILPIAENDSMLIISNKYRCYGAASILLGEVLEDIYDMYNEDFYILPSSTDECLAVPKSLMAIENMLAIVCSVNQDPDAVNESEFLTDNVFTYSRKQGRLVAYK